MSQEAQSIAKQIQELENLANEMLDAGNFNSEIFEQISQQIQEYQLQQKKLADEAKYLEEFEIQRVYQENGGKESMTFANGISGNESSLDTQFYNFLTGDDQSQVVFICENKHWLTVRLEKTPEGGITYQVADSMPENPTKNKSNREERIDTLLGDVCAKIPFKSEKQQNGYDCGIHCALNAVDMKPNVVEEHKYFNAKATYSKYDVETIRENFENKEVAQQKPKNAVKQPMTQRPPKYFENKNVAKQQPKESAKEDKVVSRIKNDFKEGTITAEQAIKDITYFRNIAEKTINTCLDQGRSFDKVLERIEALNDFEKELNKQKEVNKQTELNQPKPQQTSRLSSDPTASSLPSSDKINTFTQLNKNSQLQHSSSKGSFGTKVLMTSHSQKLNRPPSAIQNGINNSLQDLFGH